MSKFKKINPAPIKGRLAGRELTVIGDLPILQWIPISLLVIDTTYQRDILDKGARNVANIAQHFSWQKFGAIVVSKVSAGYAIIDGQHRTTAAALRGIDQVPCLLVSADEAGQAAAFAAINGNVTRMNSLQIFTAKLAAGDRSAIDVKETCEAAGVTIVKNSGFGSALKRGETTAASGMLSLRRAFGHDVLVLALRCLVETGDGNPGLIKPKIVRALCSIIEAEPSWAQQPARLLAAFENFEFDDRLAEAQVWGRQRKIGADAALSYFMVAHVEQCWKARVAA